MINYLLTSFFIHAAFFLSLYYSVPQATTSKAGGEKIEVNIREVPKFHLQAPILPQHDKYAKHGPGPGARGKEQKVDMTEYGNQLKAVVDPVWLSKVQPLNLPTKLFLATEVLLFPDTYGNIISMKILTPSGSKDFDQLALEALREVKQIPKPPESLVKEGIRWEFSVGERR
jgi:TonB family protein